MKRLERISNTWFFSELPYVFRLFLFFIKGDLIVLLPFFILIILLGFFSLKFMTIMIGVFTAVRHLGEMIYWFEHQFYERKYRPYDFGFKNLDNNAIYILYQTLAIMGTTIGIGIVVGSVMFMK